jgi:DNA-binding response OmpR family regulator
MNMRLLYVEDDDDLRQMFAMMLVNEGYDVVAVSNAEDAILELQTERYNLLLTDYNLLNKNADWLLRVAEASGSLRDTRVVILTAERQPTGVDGYRILKKPVDIAVLFACLDEAVTKSATTAAVPACAAEAPAAGVALELKLYVTATSRESIKAQRNLNRILRKFLPAGVHLEVCDVTRGELPADALELDRIVVTPTLVRTWPLPKVWIFGDLSKSEPVEAMIAAGLERIAASGTQPPESEPLET